MTKWTKKHVRRLAAALKSTGSIRGAADAIGLSYNAAETAMRRFRLSVARADPGAGTGAALSVECRRLRRELETTKRRLGPLLEQQKTASDIRNELKAAAQAPSTVARLVVKNRPPTHGPGIPSIVISDLHLNEQIIANQVFGVNAYNLDIAKRRLDTLFRAVIDLGLNHMVKPSREGIIVPVLGDLLDFLGGRAHRDGRRPLIEGVDAAALVSDLLEPGFRAWADAFGSVTSFWVPGNHGRVTDSMPYTDAGSINLDKAVFHVLSGRLRNDKRIKMEHAAGPRMIYSIYNHRFLILHGDPSCGMPNGGGDSESGWINTVARGVKRLRSLHMQMRQPFDTAIMGHGHQEAWLAGAISNGCLPGFGEYANGRALSFDTPKQAFFYTHKKYGITCRWTVHCDKGETSTL